MSNIYLRQARSEDLPKVLDIISGAKKTLRDRGVDQWQSGYPDEAILKQDLKDGINYVLLLDGEVVGTAALQQGIEENYEQIINGSWDKDSNKEYSVIHRIAVEPGHQGQHLSSALIRQLLTISYQLGYTDVRIDTHPENLVMQHVITTNGFTEKGEISMEEDDGPRKPIKYCFIKPYTNVSLNEFKKLYNFYCKKPSIVMVFLLFLSQGMIVFS